MIHSRTSHFLFVERLLYPHLHGKEVVRIARNSALKVYHINHNVFSPRDHLNIGKLSPKL